jgi:hypothetical protein
MSGGRNLRIPSQTSLEQPINCAGNAPQRSLILQLDTQWAHLSLCKWCQFWCKWCKWCQFCFRRQKQIELTPLLPYPSQSNWEWTIMSYALECFDYASDCARPAPLRNGYESGITHGTNSRAGFGDVAGSFADTSLIAPAN